MKQFGTVLKQHAAWSARKFPLLTELVALDNAKEELEQLKTDVIDGSDRTLMAVEASNVIAHLITALTKAGVKVEDLQEALESRLMINKKRKWRFNKKLGDYVLVVKKEVVKKD